jgi:hypothetical protein
MFHLLELQRLIEYGESLAFRDVVAPNYPVSKDNFQNDQLIVFWATA